MVTTVAAVGDLEQNPNGYVCLSFDFDGPSLWIQRGMTTPTSVSRGEFGAVAVPRLLRLLGPSGHPVHVLRPGPHASRPTRTSAG